MPKKLRTRNCLFSYSEYLRKRELGFKHELGYEDKLTKKLVSALRFNESRQRPDDGGIFNLEFSLDGSIMAAACEKKSILVYDALNRNLIKSIQDAHLNCVNCIRFLDNYSFASGSDDNTIKTWDMRFLKYSTRTLRGHSNWVKNIEYSSKENRLLTSAFDGGIYSWDLNNFTEQGVVYDRVFLMDGLMRMKLTPDGSKMVMCTTHGYMLIIHNLDLQTLSCDLQRFKPNIYRLMQESEQNIPIASCSNNLFSPKRKTNWVELVSDFPNNAEVISSLQIHPMGWCALTRNINNDELSEWSSVHDIQERDLDEYLQSYTVAKLLHTALPCLNTQSEDSRQHTPMDLWMGFVSNENIRTQRLLSVLERRGSGITTNRASITVVNSGILSSDNQTNGTGDNCKIMQNLSRLTHYVEEPNAGKGFIKEVGFSSDGRLICSPFYSGIRLFAFNVACNELSMCVPDQPQKLCKVAHFQDHHSKIVVSCKFNPFHNLLVSGCLGGEIVWYQPVF